MKHAVSTLFIIGWFFFMRAEPQPGIPAHTSVGPYKSKAACEAFQAEMEDYLKAVGAGVQISKCVERKDV